MKPWWEHQRGTVNCRDASVPQGGPCTEESFTSTHCSTTTDPATGEPVRHCVKLLKRYLRCAGRWAACGGPGACRRSQAR